MVEGWYISAAAVKEFMQICGLPAQEEGPSFDRAAVELEKACDEARLVKAAGEANRNAAIYRTTAVIRGRKWQLDIYVAEQPRAEGDHSQVVRVRVKRGPRPGNTQSPRR
jgi:hypothetical protein